MPISTADEHEGIQPALPLQSFAVMRRLVHNPVHLIGPHTTLLSEAALLPAESFDHALNGA